MKKKYWIKDLTDKQTIHAPTKEIALKLCGRFHELGLKWCSDKSYLEAINWLDYGRGTCYEPAYGTYCSREYCEYNNYEILTIDQLLDFDEHLKTETIEKYYIKDLTEKQVIHAPTLEIAKKLCEKFDEIGLEWRYGISYLEDNYWELRKEETCYNPTRGEFSGKTWYEEKGYEILNINQLLDFGENINIPKSVSFKFVTETAERVVEISLTEEQKSLFNQLKDEHCIFLETSVNF